MARLQIFGSADALSQLNDGINYFAVNVLRFHLDFYLANLEDRQRLSW
jgi:hypothetical protein